MRRPLLYALLLALLASSTFAPAPASAERLGFTVGLVGGIGGPVDGEIGEHTDVELQLGYDINSRDLFVLRVGRLDLDGSDDLFASDGELSYVTATGEYRLPEDFYLGGLFLGLGYYDLQTDFGFVDDSAFGFTVGVNGEFPLSDRWGILVEFTGHWADLEAENLWVMATAGVRFSF